MSEWSWVTLGFAITYLSLGGYVVALRRRTAAARQQLGTARPERLR